MTLEFQNAITIQGISQDGGTVNNEDRTIIANGVYTADTGYTGFGIITVNVKGITTTVTVGE